MNNKELMLIKESDIQTIEKSFLEKVERLALEESLEEYAEGILCDEDLYKDAIKLGYLPTNQFVSAWHYVEDRLDIGLEGFVKLKNPIPKLPRSFAKILHDNSLKGYDLTSLPCLLCEFGYAFNTSPVLGCCPKYIKGKPMEVIEGKEKCVFYKELPSSNRKSKKITNKLIKD